jgi:hypothetical protein
MTKVMALDALAHGAGQTIARVTKDFQALGLIEARLAATQTFQLVLQGAVSILSGVDTHFVAAETLIRRALRWSYWL